MQILIPISSKTTFFPKEDFYFPKPLIEVNGIPMIEVVVKQLQNQFEDIDFIFVIDSEDNHSFSLQHTLKLLTGKKTKIIEKPGPTSGALCSCLLAIDVLDKYQPLIIANSDQIIEEDLSKIIQTLSSCNCSAGVITFDSIHPRWSYLVDDEEGNVMQTFEKEVASRKAIAGLYYFGEAKFFIEASQKVILNNAKVDGNYFISSSLNEIILSGGRVAHSQIPANSYHSFYSPAKIIEYERWIHEQEPKIYIPPIKKPINVIIPAAGEGSRFTKVGWKKPKPFIEVEGKLMLEHIIENVTPRDADTTILLRKEHLDTYPTIANKLREDNHKITSVSKLTEGTVSTVLLARHFFDNENTTIIANADQIVSFDINDFVKDSNQRKLDGSILVFKDPTRNPKWSFVRVDEKGLVIEVAEKKAISDIATVGIYLFSKGKDFINAAIDMIIANDRVNNEFYTCPVYNYMIKKGARIGVYTVPMKAMSGLGTPDDLMKYLKQRGSSPSLDSPRSKR